MSTTTYVFICVHMLSSHTYIIWSPFMILVGVWVSLLMLQWPVNNQHKKHYNLPLFNVHIIQVFETWNIIWRQLKMYWNLGSIETILVEIEIYKVRLTTWLWDNWEILDNMTFFIQILATCLVICLHQQSLHIIINNQQQLC